MAGSSNPTTQNQKLLFAFIEKEQEKDLQLFLTLLETLLGFNLPCITNKSIDL